MMRWILLFFSLASLGLMFLGPSPGWVFFGVAGFLFGSIAAALAFAHSRIASSARQEDLQHHHHYRSRAPGRHGSMPPSDTPGAAD